MEGCKTALTLQFCTLFLVKISVRMVRVISMVSVVREVGWLLVRSFGGLSGLVGEGDQGQELFGDLKS